MTKEIITDTIPSLAPNGVVVHYPIVEPAPLNLSQFNLCKFKKLSLEIDDALPFDTWKELGSFLSANKRASNFWLGDWLAFGERQWGKKYLDALSLTSFTYKTLKNIKYVSANVDMSLRNDKLSFSHFYLVAGIDKKEKQFFIDKAVNESLSVKELRHAITGKDQSIKSVDVSCPKCMHAFTVTV